MRFIVNATVRPLGRSVLVNCRRTHTLFAIRSPVPNQVSSYPFRHTIRHYTSEKDQSKLQFEEKDSQPIDNPSSQGKESESNSGSKKNSKSESNSGSKSDSGSKSKSKSSLFMKYIQLSYPHIGMILLALLFIGINAGTNLLIPYGMGKTFDSFISPDSSLNDVNDEQKRKDSKARLYWLGAALTGVFGVGSFAMFARVSLLNVIAAKIVAQLRVRLFSAIMKQEAGFFDKTRTGDLVNRLSADTTVISTTLTDSAAAGLRRSIEGLGGLSVLLYLTPKLTLLMMSVVPFVFVGGVFYGRMIKKLSRQVQDSLGKTSEAAEESFSGVRTVKMFAQDQREISRYSEQIQNVYELAKRYGVLSGSFYGIIGFAGNLALLSVMVYGGTMVIDSALTIGELTSFLLYSIYVGFAFSGIVNTYGDMMKGVGASERVFEIIDRTPQIESPPSGSHPESIQGEIEFENVSFHYPTRPDVALFKSLNFHIPAGKMVAIVGSSGSGKSTVSSMLARLYDPASGIVKIDGHDIKQLDLDWLRRQIGFVSQEPLLFSGTIRENIAYGFEFENMKYSDYKTFLQSPEIEEQIITAAKRANAHDFITNFPEGYDTEIGERGITLSGGQKQRIAIARAIIKNPKILILDEATSALDAESEYLVQQALEGIMHERTTLVVAHRLSTVKQADRIIVLDKGIIVEQGTHLELMKSQGVYSNLVARQMK